MSGAMHFGEIGIDKICQGRLLSLSFWVTEIFTPCDLPGNVNDFGNFSKKNTPEPFQTCLLV